MTRIARILIAMILTAVCGTNSFAAKVSVSSAQNIASNFFKVTSNYTGRNALVATLKLTHTEADGTLDFYVFNISPKGFVIVSADDQVAPVIAYSLESNFNTNTSGKGIQNWMNHAASHIYQGIQRHTIANAQIKQQWAAYQQGRKPAAKSAGLAVAPLLTTSWDQEPFYNQLCPYNNTDHQRAVTGCAATAMAQIMKYWNFPAQGTGSYGYNDAPPTCSFTYGNQYANFGGTTYNWAAMPNSIDTTNLAIATLMYHCGVAVAMNYGDDNQGGSGAYVLSSETASWRHSVQMAYSTYFSYNPNTLTGVKEANYSTAAWVNLMKNELNAGRPIQYEGVDTLDGGHTWVCDGYDENDMLHMNWGWSGFDNGYFSVSALTADGYNFSNNEAALIGIEPLSDLNVMVTVANTTICAGGSTTLSAQGSTNVSYIWTPAKGLNCPTCASILASPDTTTTYTLTIDSAGFSASTQVTVIVSSLHVDSIQSASVSCYGGNNGQARVKLSGGTMAYNYLWNNGSTLAHASGLTAGNYGVTIIDAMGCSVSAATAITEPDPLIAVIQAANANCSLYNAVLNVFVNGGTPVYAYHWDGGQVDAEISSPVAGVYSVTATDVLGCTATASFNLVQPVPMDINIVTSNTSCSLLYGTATANVTGGHKNFSFQWNTGETTSSITHLSAGNYVVTVTDSLGCASSASIFFSLPDTMNVSIATSNIADNKVYGKAVANVTGGTPQYSFNWNTGDTSATISYATSGVYIVTITDSKGCAQIATAEVNDVAGVKEVTNNIAFEVYPNPATSQVTVHMNNANHESATMEIRNMLGQTLMSHSMSIETQIDLSELANGVYLVVLTQGQASSVKEIVKK